MTITEKDLRRILWVALSSGVDQGIIEAQNKGVVFTPEPIALPERLALDNRGFIQPEDRFLAGQPLWETEEQRQAGHEAARDRYNAYLGLREKVEKLIHAVRHNVSYQYPYRPQAPLELVDALEVELTKGPK